MLHKDKRRLYRRVRRTLGTFTPLKTDCGALCEKRCCRGDAQTGMLLFPREKTTLRVLTSGGRRLAVCRGVCRRSERPLACRLFPLLPVRSENGRMTVQPDRRGFGVCPLVRHAQDVCFSKRFCRRVRRAGELLYADADARLFLEQLWKQTDDFADMVELFSKK